VILSDREIEAAIRRGAVVITPPPPGVNDPVPRGQKSPWSSTTLDLQLDPELTIWKPPGGDGSEVTFLHPDHPDFDFEKILDRYAAKHLIPADGAFELKRGDFVLGWTREEIQLPSGSRIAARVEGKSSLARLGIGIHVTAPTIHAGFGVKRDDPAYHGSRIRLEIVHHGYYPVKLKPGMLICQLVFEEVHGTPVKGYEERGRFSVQGASPLPNA
jgi:dCTP deaminase